MKVYRLLNNIIEDMKLLQSDMLKLEWQTKRNVTTTPHCELADKILKVVNETKDLGI